jgi:hypothetical protein
MAAHLETHSMTAEDYRLTFGIPWGVSLTSAPSREATGSAMTPDRLEQFALCKPGRGLTRRPSVPAVRNQWTQDARLGRYMSQQPVDVGCCKCGDPVRTTALCAAQPIHCLKCATPEQLRARKLPLAA